MLYLTKCFCYPLLDARELYSNNISGVIPNDLGNLTSLVSLDLYLNRFSGPIPDTLGKLSKLRFLWVYVAIPKNPYFPISECLWSCFQIAVPISLIFPCNIYDIIFVFHIHKSLFHHARKALFCCCCCGGFSFFCLIFLFFI